MNRKRLLSFLLAVATIFNMFGAFIPVAQASYKNGDTILLADKGECGKFLTYNGSEIRAITLASVKNFVEQLNGYIWVESKILKSTCFNVLLPLESV